MGNTLKNGRHIGFGRAMQAGCPFQAGGVSMSEHRQQRVECFEPELYSFKLHHRPRQLYKGPSRG